MVLGHGGLGNQLHSYCFSWRRGPRNPGAARGRRREEGRRETSCAGDDDSPRGARACLGSLCRHRGSFSWPHGTARPRRLLRATQLLSGRTGLRPGSRFLLTWLPCCRGRGSGLPNAWTHVQSLQLARRPPAGVLRTGSGSAKARNWTALRKPTAHPLRPGQVVPTGGPRGGAPVHPEADCASGWAPGQGASTQAMTEPKATGPPWSRQ